MARRRTKAKAKAVAPRLAAAGSRNVAIYGISRQAWDALEQRDGGGCRGRVTEFLIAAAAAFLEASRPKLPGPSWLTLLDAARDYQGEARPMELRIILASPTALEPHAARHGTRGTRVATEFRTLPIAEQLGAVDTILLALAALRRGERVIF